MTFMQPTVEDQRFAQARITAKILEDSPEVNKALRPRYIAPRKARRETFKIVDGSKAPKSKEKIRAQRKKERKNRRKR